MMRLVRSAFVIGRRDFAATVFSKAFLFFLLGPLFPVLLGALFGGIGAHVASEGERPVVAVIAPQAEFDRMAAAREELVAAVESPVVRLIRFDAELDIVAQERRLLASTK